MVQTDPRRDRIIQELSAIAFGDIRKLYREDGSLKKIAELDDETAASLSGVDVSSLTKTDGEDGELTITVKKVRRFDKIKAIEILARILGVLKDETNVNVNISLEKLVLQAVEIRNASQ